jgi:hypothetical protein
MEFDLHVITSGTKANISLTYDTKDKVDKERLKQAVYDVVECIIDNQNTDFVESKNILLVNNEVETPRPEASYRDFGVVPPKYDGQETIQGTTMSQPQASADIVINNDMDYLAFVVNSQLKYVKQNALQE